MVIGRTYVNWLGMRIGRWSVDLLKIKIKFFELEYVHACTCVGKIPVALVNEWFVAKSRDSWEPRFIVIIVGVILGIPHD